MNSIKILAAALPLFLAGCFGSSAPKTTTFPSQQPQQQPDAGQQNRTLEGLRNPETRHIRDPKAMPQPHQPQTPCPGRQIPRRNAYQANSKPSLQPSDIHQQDKDLR